jgi:hypothetical protein
MNLLELVKYRYSCRDYQSDEYDFFGMLMATIGTGMIGVVYFMMFEIYGDKKQTQSE